MYSFVAGCGVVILRADNTVKIKIRGGGREEKIYAKILLRPCYCGE